MSQTTSSCAGILIVLSAACACRGAPTTPSAPPELADVIEALFLGSGPLAAGDCLNPGQWTTWPAGASVTLKTSSTIDAAGRGALALAAAEVNASLAGRFAITLQDTAEADPSPEHLEITSADVSVAIIAGTCSPGGAGCTKVIARNGPELLGVRSIQRTGTSTRLKVHEFGHAIGLCHVERTRLPEAVMADPPQPEARDRFSAIELSAIRAVYAAGLQAGAIRADFRAAGLVR